MRSFPILLVLVAACASGGSPEVPAKDGAKPRGGDSGAITGPCLACEDNNPCTQDLCLAGGGCSYEPATGDPCDDDDTCTTDDRCDASGKCAGTDLTSWIYRFKNPTLGTYYYSRAKDNPPKGYNFEKKLFRIFQPDTPGTIPLYRLLSTQHSEFMLSRQPDEAAACCGYKNNGLVGHIYPKEQPNTVQLHRLKKTTSTMRHISTLDPNEGKAAGFQYDYSPGFVCP